MSTFRMTYTSSGVTQEYEYPADRLWEVVERADKAFLPPLTFDDGLRFRLLLQRDEERRHPKAKKR